MITAVILTKNEENNIVDCLESVLFCDKTLVLDDESTDNTVRLAELKGAKVIKKSLGMDFSHQRNFALSHVKSGWVLFLDADERITKELREEIVGRALLHGKTDGYFIQRKDKLFGKVLNHGEVGNKFFLRFAKYNAGKWEGKVHEVWKVEGKTGKLSNFIIHEPHKTIKEFLSEINFYTTLRAEELSYKNVKSSAFSILLYANLKFIKVYFLKLGILDGMPGLQLSLMMSFHSFLTRAKLYLLQKSHER